MSATATWSTRATPLALAAAAVTFTLGVFCIVLAALTLALGDAAWNLSAYTCLLLAACLAVVRMRRACRRANLELAWDDSACCFCVPGVDGPLALAGVWHGPAWVTLSLRAQESSGQVLRLVVWKSVVPAPLWSELVLRIQAGEQRETAIRTRKIHEPA